MTRAHGFVLGACTQDDQEFLPDRGGGAPWLAGVRRGEHRRHRLHHDSFTMTRETTMAATTAAHQARSSARTRAGFDRRALAIAMPIGPLAIAIVRGILPYFTTDSNTTMAAKVAAHQGTESVVIWLTLVALFTLIPGVIALGLLAKRHAPRLGTAGLVLSFAGFMCLFWSTVAGSDNVALGAARIGLNPAVTGRLLTSMGAIPAIGFAAWLFPVGHVLGLILLGIALWRGRAVPAWAALAIAVSQVLHVIFAVIVPNHALDGLSWGLTAVGFAVAAVAFARDSGPRPAATPAEPAEAASAAA
jgi:hypothetical protein